MGLQRRPLASTLSKRKLVSAPNQAEVEDEQYRRHGTGPTHSRVVPTTSAQAKQARRRRREQGRGRRGRRDPTRRRPLLASPPNVAVPRELKAAAGQNHRRAGPPPSLRSAMEEEGEHPAGGRREGGGRGCRRGLRRGARGRPCELRWLALEAPLAARTHRCRRKPCADPAAAIVAPRGGGRPEIHRRGGARAGLPRPAREKLGRHQEEGGGGAVEGSQG